MKKQKSSEEIDRHLRNIELHLKEKRPDLLLEDIRKLKKHTIYSDVHADAYDKHEELKPKVIRFLFKHLPLEQFVAIHEEDIFFSAEIYDALDAISKSVPIDQLLTLVEKLEFPSEAFGEKLYRKLVDDPSESTTRKLEEWIRRGCAREAEEGASFSQHQKTMSSFRYMRWMPDDHGLSKAVGILAQRRDALSRKLAGDYLLTLPWGGDRRATSVLLEALFSETSEENRNLIEEALGKYKTPGKLRLMLLGYYGEYDAQRALKMCVEDLGRLESNDDRFSYLDWLWTALEQVKERKVSIDEHQLGDVLATLQTDRWSFFSKGYLGVILDKKFQKAAPARVSNIFQRFAIDLIRVFESTRLDHMGCLISIPVLFGVGYLFLLLLNFVMNKPERPFSFVDDIALILWIISAGVTSRTHFSGHESMKEKFWLATIFWVTLLSFLSVSVAIRV